MAAGGYDGSLKFDTKINTDGFDGGVSTLTKAMERLTSVVETLSGKIDGAFAAVGNAARTTTKDVDGIAEAAKQAREELERLQKEKASTFTGTITNNNGISASSFPDDGVRRDIYGNDVDAAIAKQQELAAASRETAETVVEGTQQEQASIVGLRESMMMAVDAFGKIPSGIRSIFRSIVAPEERAQGQLRNLQDEVDRYTDALHYAEQAGYSLGDQPYDEAYEGLSRAKRAADEYRRSLAGLDNNQKKAGRSAKNMGRSLKSVDKVAMPLTKSILKLSSMFKLMLVRMSMRAVIQGARDGFQNLVQYSDKVNVSASMVVSAMTRLKNSFATAFAPILEVAAPALKRLIDSLSEAAAWAGKLFAALSGKDTFVKAVDVEEDYGAALKDSNKQLKEKEKATKKLSFSFDSLIQAQKESEKPGYVGPTPDQMFETVGVEKDIKSFADTVKGIFSDLFAPLKQSWQENGSWVTEAAKAAFSSLKTLAGDVGTSFMQVWKTEGYGKAITDDLLVTFGNLLLTVKNLADRFDDAWKKGDTGTSIIRHLGDIILIVTGFFRQATENIKNWAATLDFSPLLKSFDDVLVKLRPIVDKVGKILLWLLDNVLLPLAQWALEKAIPAIFDLISGALEVLNSVLDALQPLAMWLWDSFLKPLGEWTGKVIIDALEKVVKWLTNFSDWISQHQTAVENIAIAVASFFAAWKFVQFASGVAGMLAKLPLLIDVIGGLFGALNPVAIVLGAIVTVAVLVAKAWDKMTPGEQLATKILAVAGAIGVLVFALGSAIHMPDMIAAGFAVAAVAGIGLMGISFNAMNRSSYSSKASSLSAQGMSLSRQAIPRLATGTVVPPRAGEFAAILGDNNRDTEIVSPVPAMKQAFREAIEEMGGLGGNQTLKADMIVDSTKFAQLVYKFNNQEKQRVGIRMVAER